MDLKRIDKFYNVHSKFYDLTRPFVLFNRKKAVKLLNVDIKDKVIDLACGTGLNIPLLLKNTSPKNIVGIDYSESMLRKAKKKYPNIKFIKADVSTYKFKKKVDKIICSYSLSLMENWRKTIVNVKNSLKKGGTFIVLDFYIWKGWIKIFYPLFRKLLYNRYGIYLEKNIENHLKKNFKKVNIMILNSGYNFIAIAKFPK